MTTRQTLRFKLSSPEDTDAFAARIGSLLLPGDCLMLDGPVGAGKTHFARHLIRSLMAVPEDVPSPTFTLVQTYDSLAGEIWHADLYRLRSAAEIHELGLADAFDRAICLVEWPEKLGDLVPDNALWLGFYPDPNDENRRDVTLSWSAGRWKMLTGMLVNDS